MPSPDQSSPVLRADPSGDPLVDALVYGRYWGDNDQLARTTISFSIPGFHATWSPLAYDPANGPPTVDYSPIYYGWYFALDDLLRMFGNAANLAFREVTESDTRVGDLRLAATNYGMEEATAYAYLPDKNPAGGDIWIDIDMMVGSRGEVPPGSAYHLILMHELGHALGLKHPFEARGDATAVLPAAYDNLFWTVMSYTPAPGAAQDAAMSIYPTTLMALDIAALQYLYGRTAHNAGNSQYDYGSANAHLETLWDTGGIDTLVITGNDDVLVSLVPGSWSRIGQPVEVEGVAPIADNVYIYDSTLIEHANGGGGDDTLLGNRLDNMLRGGAGHDDIRAGAGHDTLAGETGNDTLAGGSGNDFYLYGDGDTLLEHAGGGIDRVQTSSDLVLDDHVEHVVVTGFIGCDVTGNAGHNRISGNDDGNRLAGLAGDDTLSGQGGNDVLAGGTGRDLLLGGKGRDQFLFDSAPLAANRDQLQDFDRGDDSLQLDSTVFTALAAGTLAADAFCLGLQARDAADRLVYDRDSGRLYYDADGRGGADGILFAQFKPDTALAASDIQVA